MTVAPASSAGLVTSRLLAVTAAFVAALAICLILSAAGDTLGYDFRAYLEAAHRLLHGTPLYDPGVDVAGGFAIYLYPPPFAIALVPFALLPGTAVPTLAWTALIVAALLVAISVLPVRPWVRWTLLLVAGLSWPVLYTLKLGQVGTLLLLCFAVAWRCIDRPVPLGLSIASGTLVKLQPVLLLPWALAVGRWRAATSSVVALAAVCIASLLVVGTSAWADYVALLRRVSDPVSTPHTVSPGAVAYQSGLSLEAATLFQWLAVAGVVAITLHAWFRRDPGASLVVTAVASQVLSPLVWDHYAMVLLLPVALVLDRLGRRAWPVVLLPIAGWLPAPVYPALFAVGLVAAWGVGRPREGPGPRVMAT